MNTGLEGKYVIKNNKKLALGYTTGSCGAAAAKAAAVMLFIRQEISHISLMTPKGIALNLKVEEPKIMERSAVCAIRKDAGDDPDVTHGVLVYARVSLFEPEERGGLQVRLDGGEGVGRVTKPGLEQAVGEAAINRVPRAMITEAVTQICEENDYKGGIEVIISIPKGAKLAQKTFNPRLGIEGGISVLGTSGIVEPMSEAALIASIRLEMQMHRSNGAKYLLAAPGNYGTAYLTSQLPFHPKQAVKCSNFIGETIDMALELEYKGILFVSHIGKFIKVAGGIMNTHSRNGDARMEIMTANALMAGAGLETLKQMMEAVTTDEALKVLNRAGVLAPVMERIMEKISFYLDHRAYGKLEMGAIVFSNEWGELGQAGPAAELIGKLQKDKERQLL